MTKVCPKCNQLNLPQAAFCSGCASPLAAAGGSQAQPQQQWSIQGAAPPASTASTRATVAAGLAVGALLCCGPFTGIPAVIVGWMELSAINAGQSSPAGRWMAQVGIWLGIGATILHSVLIIVWLFLGMLGSMRAY